MVTHQVCTDYETPHESFSTTACNGQHCGACFEQAMNCVLQTIVHACATYCLKILYLQKGAAATAFFKLMNVHALK